MKLNEIAQELDDLSVKVWALDGLITAISDALFLAQRRTEDFEGAMYAMQDTSWALVEKSRQITDELFALIRTGESSGSKDNN